MSRSGGLPAGVLAVEPEELLVNVRAGTSMDELAEVLKGHRQRLRVPMVGFVGGAVASRRNGPYPVDNKAMPNIVLRVCAVDGEGRAFRAGGSTVKNVSGFDLLKVLVGSRGTLATITEVLFRTEPIPRSSRWFSGAGETSQLYRPSLVTTLDGSTVVNLEGHPADVEEQAKLLSGFDEIDPIPDHELMRAVGSSTQNDVIDPVGLEICRRMKTAFDPHNRLAPELSRRLGLV